MVQHIVVNADPAATYQAVLDADLMDDRLTQLMVTARNLPNRLRAGRAAVSVDLRPDPRQGQGASFRMRDAAGDGVGLGGAPRRAGSGAGSWASSAGSGAGTSAS